jgi:N-methylhydantoinase A
MGYMVGVDTGGTFTDCVVIDSKGNVAMGKAPSTPSDFSDGVIDAVADAASSLGVSPADLLRQTNLFGHATTVTTNALLTRSGAKTGLITTKGFEDTLIIGRVHQKVAGLTEAEAIHAVRLEKAVPIVPRTLIKGVSERVDYKGDEIVPLNIEEAMQAVEMLINEGVEAIAICFLWSFMDPVHEKKVKEAIREKYPDILVMTSYELVPRMGEYERTATIAINCILGSVASTYIQNLSRKLSTLGLEVPILVLQCTGGVLPAREIAERAIYTLSSGPVGGIAASAFWGNKLGFKNIICADVGGTSFDVGLIINGEPQRRTQTIVNKYHILVPSIAVSSIGTGGGSIAHVEPGTGILLVGPESAGADPGPVCYDKGGEQPTLTDAALVLGYLNPDYFLAGKIKLNKEKSISVIQEQLASPLGVDVFEAAAGVCKVATSQMADLVRKVTIEQGYDPRDCVLLTYGGAGPQYAAAYGRETGVKAVVIPTQAPVFSAFGTIASNVSEFHSLSDPCVFPPDLGRVNRSFQQLEEKALQDLMAQGFSEDQVVLERSAEMRYRRQVHDVRVPVPTGTLGSQHMDELVNSFEKRYEELHGRATGYRKVGIEVIAYNVVGTGLTERPIVVEYESAASSDPSTALKSKRPLRFPDSAGFVDADIYDAALLKPGHILRGPAIVEAASTTIILEPGQEAEVDKYLNTVIRAM